MRTILLGDPNGWRRRGGLALSRCRSEVEVSAPARQTFPRCLPVLPLDRILPDGGGGVREARALRDAVFATAPDHLPLWVRVTRGVPA